MDAQTNAQTNLDTYLGAREPTARYSSFDYCFNYFRSHREQHRVPELVTGAGLQVSCLHLGFYLASWGMLRGSADLLKRSVKHLAPVLTVIAGVPETIWGIDADDYSDERCGVILDTARQIRGSFPEGASDILVTKIMLGVFGCVPAFDTYFKKGFGVSTFGRAALKRVGRYYEEHADLIDRNRVTTLDFDTGTATSREYTRAKKIDMIFFIEGGQRPRGAPGQRG